ACVFFSSRRRHTRSKRDWSSDVCSSDLSFLQASERVMTRFCVPRSARLGGRRREMDHRRKLQSGQERASRFSVHPKIFVFFDKSTGTRLFEVTAREDGRMPQEQAVSLLAMHCVARQQMPKDFGVMVATGE